MQFSYLSQHVVRGTHCKAEVFASSSSKVYHFGALCRGQAARLSLTQHASAETPSLTLVTPSGTMHNTA